MKTCKIKLVVELQVDAFTVDDAADLAIESIHGLEGLGVTVVDVTLAHQAEL